MQVVTPERLGAVAVGGKWMLASTCGVAGTNELREKDWLGVNVGIVSLAVKATVTVRRRTVAQPVSGVELDRLSSRAS